MTEEQYNDLVGKVDKSLPRSTMPSKQKEE